MSQPTISVLMSVYNAEKYLRQAIDSVINQSYQNFELIIINDSSTDRSGEILNSYTDNRIKIIKNTINLGLTKSLNLGLSLAKGYYIARFDADDICLPTRLEKQKEFLDKNKNIVLVGGSIIIIDGVGNIIGKKMPPTDPQLLKFYLILKNQINHSAVMFRKKIILDIGGYNESIKYAQDYDLWSRLLEKNYEMANISDPVIKYRFHNESITQGKTKNESDYYASRTTHKNLNRYIKISDNELAIWLQALHKNNIQGFKNLIFVLKFLKNFKQIYFKKESPKDLVATQINKYINHRKIQAIKSYIKGIIEIQKK